ncbi:MAG: hypothetical protein JW774_11765 [Candidatus Aureabacteria bacterium]|nr:hypothetical protein [Candidatus Auribacterota bacterium]
MNWISIILIPSAFIFLKSCAILGIFLGIGLIASPETVKKIEKKLSGKCFTSSNKMDEHLDESRNLEHLFFNHHLITGTILILLPSVFLLLALYCKCELNVDLLDNFRTGIFLYFSKDVLYPLATHIFRIISFFSIILGTSILIIPQYAFRLLRWTNKSIPTDYLKKTVQKEFSVDNFFYGHSKCTGWSLLFLSGLLLYLVQRI